MRAWYQWVLLLALVAPLQAEQRQPSLLIIGDSISGGYRPMLAEMLQERYAVSRIQGNGKDTRNGMARLDAWLGEGGWDVIVFNWGLHDLKNGSDDPAELERRARAYRERLSGLVERLEQTGARLIWVTTSPVPEPNQHRRMQAWVLRFNQVAAEVMSERGISIADTHAVIAPVASQHEAPSRREGMRDVHFQDTGYRLMAEVVAATVIGQQP